jgi:hypothetical protein
LLPSQSHQAPRTTRQVPSTQSRQAPSTQSRQVPSTQHHQAPSTRRRQTPRVRTQYAVLGELLASLGIDEDTRFLIIGQLSRSTENGFDWQTHLLSELAFPPDVASVILDMVLQFEHDIPDLI